MMLIFVCRKCETECSVEMDRADPNDACCWCETCNDHAEGFDPTDYASDYFAGLADDAMDYERDNYWND
jgi:hypothetical protein